MLNFVQALIFSILTLMFTLLAIEGHDDEEGSSAEEDAEALDAAIHGQRAARLTEAPAPAPSISPVDPSQPAGRSGGTTRWSTSAPVSQPSGSSDPASASASWPASPPTAIGRNPDAAAQIRGLAIILAAFAEGLGVLAIVVGLLAIFL